MNRTTSCRAAPSRFAHSTRPCTASTTQPFSASSWGQSRPNCSTPVYRRGSVMRWIRSVVNRRRNTARAQARSASVSPITTFHSSACLSVCLSRSVCVKTARRIDEIIYHLIAPSFLFFSVLNHVPKFR